MKAHIVIRFPALMSNSYLVSHQKHMPTGGCKCIDEKGKSYPALISCVGNIIYQIKHVPAGKLCTNYTVNHR